MIWGTGTGCSATQALANLLLLEHEPLEHMVGSEEWENVPHTEKEQQVLDAVTCFGGAVSWRFASGLELVRDKDPEAQIVVVIRNPWETLECMKKKNIFQERRTDIPHAYSSWGPLGHWCYCADSLVRGLHDDLEDWEGWKIDELPIESKTNQSPRQGKGLTGLERRLIDEGASSRWQLLVDKWMFSVERGRPIYDKQIKDLV